jgi:hypothetical protein
MATSWDPVLLPPGYAYGFSGGPAFDTRITETGGGGEFRVQTLEEPKWRWQALRKNFSPDADVDGLIDWFLARRGPLYGFLFLDPRDFSTAGDKVSAPNEIDQIIGFGDGIRTRFRLRKQYRDPGGMTARDFPRRVVPLLGTATPEMARMFDVEPGANIAPRAAAGGVYDSGATFLPLSQEVVLSSPPGVGVAVTWGGYHVVPVRFDNVEGGIEATITGFLTDEAPFELVSLPFDDPVPLIAGGSPYGHEVLPAIGSCELSGRKGFLKECTTAGEVTGYLDDLNNYPTGGPHMRIVNLGAVQSITVRDAVGNLVGAIGPLGRADLFAKEDAAGNRTPVLFG